jgi:CheY-like chemotaxis protein
VKKPVVLIVEDEPFIRIDAVAALEASDFDVIDVSNADEAIAVLEARDDVTVIFTDIQMPGSMDGLKLAAAVRHRWPPIRIIATSGNMRVSERDLPEDARFLPKPYHPAQLKTVFREVAR